MGLNEHKHHERNGRAVVPVGWLSAELRLEGDTLTIDLRDRVSGAPVARGIVPLPRTER